MVQSHFKDEDLFVQNFLEHFYVFELMTSTIPRVDSFANSVKDINCMNLTFKPMESRILQKNFKNPFAKRLTFS